MNKLMKLPQVNRPNVYIQLSDVEMFCTGYDITKIEGIVDYELAKAKKKLMKQVKGYCSGASS